MHPDELGLDDSLVVRLVAEQFPQWAELPLERIPSPGTDNVLYPMKESLRLRATGGEVAHALRDVWGTYIPRDAF